MRIYNVQFEDVLVAAAQDLVLITGAAAKMYFILEHWVGVSDTTLAVGQGLKIRSRYLPATVAVGSGGTINVTPSKVDPGDPACTTTTCGTNNTTKATTTGTAIVLFENGVHLYQGERYRFPEPERPVIGNGEAFVFELLSTVTGTVHLSGGVKIGEVGG